MQELVVIKAPFPNVPGHLRDGEKGHSVGWDNGYANFKRESGEVVPVEAWRVRVLDVTTNAP